MTGLLGRLRKLSTNHDEDQSLHEESVKAGCVPLGDQHSRERITAHGTLRSVTLRPVDGLSWLEAEMYDGTATLTLIWLGRRRIEGIECGREMTVYGRLGTRDGARIMFNPRYELTA